MGWKLEVAKMFMYLSFPVGIFYYVNQPAYFDTIIKTKQEYFPLESKKASLEVENFIREFNANIEKKRLEEMELQYENNNKEKM